MIGGCRSLEPSPASAVLVVGVCSLHVPSLLCGVGVLKTTTQARTSCPPWEFGEGVDSARGAAAIALFCRNTL